MSTPTDRVSPFEWNQIRKIIKFWPVPCLFFYFYALHTLCSDSYEVLYLKNTKMTPLQFLVCKQLSDLYPNQTEVELKELRGRLYDHFSSEKYYRRRENNRREFQLILNRTKSGDYLVLNRMVCLIANDKRESLDINYFLYDVRKMVSFAIQGDTLDFVRMETPYQKIEQKTVLKRGHPYSDCREKNGRFRCLNECFRRRFRLARYFYEGNETGLIQLNYSESDRMIQESERTCFGECERENCKLVQMILMDSIEPKLPETFEAEPVLSAFDFWLQITGLIFSFVGLFFDQLVSTATKCTRSNTRQRKVKIILFYLNLAIILLSLAYGGYLCVRVALNQQAEANDLVERESRRNLIYPKSVHLAVCVRLEKVETFQSKTMWEIEKTTEGKLDDALEGIHVSDGGRSFRANYHVHRKTLFKELSGYSGMYLQRCSPLSIHLNHQTVASRPKLIIRLKKETYIYVLSEENLNSNFFSYTGHFAFKQRIVKRLESSGKCVNYKKKYANCTGRQNCVERCIARKFIERYNKITFGTEDYHPVDRDWFSESEWNTSRLIRIPYGSIYWSKYLNVSRECKAEVPDVKECDETKFERTFPIIPPDDQTMEIDLRFDVVRSVEELPSSFRMALDLLGIQSIFFGFTFLQLLWLIYQFTKPKWRLKKKTNKVIWFLICLLCSIGCSWTTVRMLDVIVNGELVPIEHYESAERIQMPAMVFCLRIDQKLIDRNHQLTGGYLEQLTANITTESTFKSIAYLNKSNEWTPFDLHLVERFFLLDMKCFRVDVDQTYDRNQFHFSDNTQVLRVNFSNARQYRFVHFMTQSEGTAEFSSISNLNYLMRQRYRISHEACLYEHKDRFGFLRRHYPSLQEGDLTYLHKKLLELQGNEPNRRTLKLPVQEEHFDLEVDEDGFDQLYLAQKQENPNKRINLNYRQTFVINHVRRKDFKFDFSFHLIFLSKIVHWKNEVNYATLTLALFNLLSLWLELCSLDLRPVLVRLHDYLLVPLYLHLPIHLLRKLIKGLLFSCRWLKKLKPQLYDLIKPRSEDSSDGSSTSDQSPASPPAT